MTNPDMEKLSRNLTEKDKNVIKNLNNQDIKEKINSIDLSLASRKMREMGLGDAADKLSGMSNDDIINAISKNPQVLDKLKKLFK